MNQLALKRKGASPIRYVVLLFVVIGTIVWVNIEDPSAEPVSERGKTARLRCRGKRVYIYDLPTKYNQDFLDNCAVGRKTTEADRCTVYENGGFGRPLTSEDGPVFDGGSQWWATDAHALEVVFHRRMQNHLCRVDDLDQADMFFVPFYAALDFERAISVDNPSKQFIDSVPLALAEWLSKQPPFIRYGGRDHFMVLGSPTWSFRRMDKLNDTWGSQLEYIPEFDSMMTFEVERHPWAPGHSMGIPYPTGFHPTQDDALLAWQNKVQASERDILWSYVAIGAANQEVVVQTRDILIKQCAEAESCKFVNCTEPTNPNCTKADIMEVYLRSKFSIQPKAETFTTQAIFGSMLAGAVPVFLWRESAYEQYQWHFPDKPDTYSVYIPFDDLPTWTKVEEQLKKIGEERVAKMQETVAMLLPKLVYLDPEHWSSDVKDAADIALDGFSKEVRQMRRKMKPLHRGPLVLVNGAGREDDDEDETAGIIGLDWRSAGRRQQPVPPAVTAGATPAAGSAVEKVKAQQEGGTAGAPAAGGGEAGKAEKGEGQSGTATVNGAGDKDKAEKAEGDSGAAQSEGAGEKDKGESEAHKDGSDGGGEKDKTPAESGTGGGDAAQGSGGDKANERGGGGNGDSTGSGESREGSGSAADGTAKEGGEKEEQKLAEGEKKEDGEGAATDRRAAAGRRRFLRSRHRDS